MCYQSAIVGYKIPPPGGNEFKIAQKYPSLLFGYSYSMISPAYKNTKTKKNCNLSFWAVTSFVNICHLVISVRYGTRTKWIFECTQIQKWVFSIEPDRLGDENRAIERQIWFTSFLEMTILVKKGLISANFIMTSFPPTSK